jgi:hypothetical protein
MIRHQKGLIKNREKNKRQSKQHPPILEDTLDINIAIIETKRLILSIDLSLKT